MAFVENVLRILDVRMETPQLYGWYHILCLILTVAATVLLCRYYQNRPRDSVRHMVLTVALAVIFLEVYKQVNFSLRYEDGLTFDYQWYAFPFQFCSTPMYVGLLAGLTKKGKVHEAACAYLATYAVFAGVCVMLYPSTVFIDVIGINIQTMVCHGSMIVVGACLLSSGYVKLEHRTVLKAIPVFAVCVALAALMNELAYRTGLLETDGFNMFYISPHCDPFLPVYSMVQEVVPFPLDLVIYIAAFTLAAYLILLAAMGIKALSRKGSGCHI